MRLELSAHEKVYKRHKNLFSKYILPHSIIYYYIVCILLYLRHVDTPWQSLFLVSVYPLGGYRAASSLNSIDALPLHCTIIQEFSYNSLQSRLMVA